MIIQAARFNRSSLGTAVVAIFSSNLKLADAPGNVFVPFDSSGLDKDSVVNVSQFFTLNRWSLMEYIGRLPPKLLSAVDDGLRMVLES